MGRPGIAMLTLGALAGLVLGLLARGNLLNLARVELRWPILVFAALAIRLATEFALARDVAAAEALRFPLFGLAFGLLLVPLWLNRGLPGLSLAFVGVTSNTIAMLANGGAMPVWEPSLVAAGLDAAELTSPFHTILPGAIDAQFLARAGPLGDVIPIPIPLVRSVASIGDLFLAGGLAFFLFSTLLRASAEDEAQADAPAHARSATATLPSRAATSLAPGLAEASVLERPISLGSGRSGVAAPSLEPLPFETATRPTPLPHPPALPLAQRLRRHPYVRLALNPAFSALWLGQLISLFGDRIHQIALAFLIFGATGSPAAVGAVFLAAALPNLLFAPLAGTLVDRWDHRRVLVASDLLRAGLVFLLPIVAVIELFLVYPVVFLLTSVSIFFRPARVAILPRIVHKDDLLTANSATWIGETLADIVGYPLAGLFVAFLGAALPVAFWVDSASYVASALLLATIVVPPLVRAPREAGSGRWGREFVADLGAGWHFLRRETILLANTIQASVAQFTVGVLIALTPIYAAQVLERGALDPESAYAFLEAGVGVGNLLGGFLMGLIGARLARGRAVIAGYAVWGLCTALLALTGNLWAVMGLMLGSGIANMVFVIPSQTLFQERTPIELIGRVVGLRFGFVFGAMTIAMGVGGVLGELFGPAIVIGAFGLVTVVAGLAGLLFPAVRDA